MNALVHLIAFWSAYFVSSQGSSIIRVEVRDRLIELLDALPSSFEGAVELRGQATMLAENAALGVEHPFNQAMFAFMLEYEKEIPAEFRENVDNIKMFFRSCCD